jgi:hypothetical protein
MQNTAYTETITLEEPGAGILHAGIRGGAGR